MFEVFTYSNDEISQAIKDDISEWSIGLWWDDLDEADVSNTILVWDDNDIIGFQTINSDNETIAIEVKESYQGKGISRLMINESKKIHESD